MVIDRLTWRETLSRIRADRARLISMLSSASGEPPVLAAIHPSFICVVLYRLSNHFHRARHRYLARLFWHLNVLLTGADISEPADFGEGLVIVSPAGIHIMAKSGRNLTIMPLAGLGGELGRREDIGAGPGNPVLGDDVTLEPHCGILGPIRIGHRVRVGATTVVTRDVPDDMTVQGSANKVSFRRNSP